MIIIVDSDGLIGIFNKEDQHHKKSEEVLKKMMLQKALLIYPATTIAETTAILQIRLNNFPAANKVLEFVKSNECTIEPVNQEVLINAISYLKPERNKHITLFDAIVASIAKRYNADAIFSFDSFYKKKGFKLASDL